jgi:hypothetical protein
VTVEEKIGIDIVPQFTGLPANSGKIEKCAFIRVIKSDNEYDLMVIDKQNKSKHTEDYGANWFINNYLGCTIIDNERDETKKLISITEKWTQNALSENADKQELVRKELRKHLKEEDTIDLEKFSEQIFSESPEIRDSFITFASESGIG